MSIFYVAPLNQTTNISAGLSIGSIQAQESLNGTTVVDGSSTLTNVLDCFKFYTTPDANNDASLPLYNSGEGLTGQWTAKDKTVSAFVNGNVGTAVAGNHLEVTKELARSVFGDSEAYDLFSNQSAINTSIGTAFSTMLAGVNNNTSATSTRVVGNAMLYRDPDRFALKYNAVIVGEVALSATEGSKSIYKDCHVSDSTGDKSATADVTVVDGVVTFIHIKSHTGVFALNEDIVFSDHLGHTNLHFKYSLTSANSVTKINSNAEGLDVNPYVAATSSVPHSGFVHTLTTDTLFSVENGVYTQVVVHNGVNNSGAKCTIRLASDGAIKQIIVTTVATTPFARTNTANFINGVGTDKNLTIPSLNPVQVAYLNGTLDDTNGTSFPFEAGDVVRVKYSIANNANQYVAGSTTVIAKMDYSCYMDFVVA